MGAVLYELVTGKQPYQAENSVAMLRAILEEPLTPPSEHRPDLNRDLETILLRALAKDQRDRYPNAEAMAADLRRQRRGQRVRATRIGWWKPLVRRAYYHRRAISVIALVAFILSMATYLIVRRTQAMIARQNERIEETIELEARLEASWLEAWRHQKDLEKGGGIAFESAAALGEGLELLRPLHDNGQLVSIPSALRGRFVVTPLAPDSLVEFLFADRAVGLGYGLRLVADPYRSDTWMLQLLRARSGADAGDRAIVASATVDQVSLNSPTRINISREDNTIVASVDDVEVLRFVDLVPYEGPQHNRVGFLLRSGSARVSGAILERQRRPELISRLELADSVRQDGRFERAVDMYREFLADFPASERARDARYRIGLCLVALERDGEALEIFSDVAEANVDDPPYYIAAMFQSWGCALRLERYDLAEQYYGAIRNRFEVDSLLAAIPQETIADLPKRYLERALRVAEQDPTSAFDLFETAAEIALFLRQTREAAEVIRRAANLLYLNGQLDGARERLLDLVDDPRLRTRDRILARMRLAEIERELGDEIASQHHYTTVINDPQTPRETRQWAHLWLGDLLLHQGRREEAELNWVEDDNRKSLPGQIMHNLLVGEGPLPLVKDPWFANDVAYFNAVWHGLRGDEDAYRAALRECAEIGDPDDWPTIHAERRLDDTVPAIFITPGTDFFEP
jgi:tetratricopeptide (TPR) repeat protein